MNKSFYLNLLKELVGLYLKNKINLLDLNMKVIC
jgi:hypothetical protein